MSAYLLVLGGYAAALSLLGLFFSRRVRSSLDFFVAGRRLAPGLLFSTLAAANIGAGSTVGAAALGYQLGLSAWWWVGSAGIGSLVLAWTVGPRIWQLAQARDFLTVGDFLESRYSRSVRAIVAVLINSGSLFILAGQLLAAGWILNLLTGVPRDVGCWMAGLLVIAYFASGGLKGTAWINLIQLAVIALGFAVAVPLVLMHHGGWSNFQAAPGLADRPPAFWSPFGIGTTGILAYLLLLMPSFIISPGLLQKIYGARDAQAVRIGTGLNGLLLLLYAALPVLLGMAARAGRELSHPDLALPSVLAEGLPFWLGALLLAAVFSAEVSSADAVLFMLSTSVSRDAYQRFWKPSAGETELLLVARLSAVGAGGIGIALALFLDSVIGALTIFYSLLTVALAVPLIVGLYSRAAGHRTCIRAIGISLAAALLVHQLTAGRGLLFLSPTAIGISVSAAVFMAEYVWRHLRGDAR